MPSLRARTVQLGGGYERAPQHEPTSGPVPVMHPPVPAPPSSHLMRSRFMLTSLPAIAQSGDGGVRQFYSTRNLPTFRVPIL